MHLHNPLALPPKGQNKLNNLELTFLEAAKNRDGESLRKCIRFGVDVNARDSFKGNAAVHLVLAQGCYSANCLIKTERCLKILLRNKANPNLENFSGKTPLHFVVSHAVPMPATKLLISYGATLVKGNGINDPKLARKIGLKMPQVAAALLDRAVSFAPGKTVEIDDVASEGLKLDWRYLVYNSDVSKVRIETKFLNEILSGTENRKIILTHPLVKAFLRLKQPLYWRHFGLFYCVWIVVTLLTQIVFTWMIYNSECKYNSSVNLTSNLTQESHGTPCKIDIIWSAVAFLTFAMFICGPAFLEYRKLMAVGLKVYLTQWQNYIFQAAAVCVSITLYPALLTPFTDGNEVILEWEFGFSAVGLLVGSMYILIQLMIIPFVALYLEMMFKILWKILLAALSLSPLVAGFFLAFKVLLPQQSIGAFQLLTMITTDTNYEEMAENGRDDFYEIALYSSFAAFIIIVVIVLINFLIGLAVSDIQELRESAKATNLANQVRSYYLMDTVYGNKRRNDRAVTRGGRYMSYVFHPLDEKDGSVLSEDVKLELLSLARARCSHPIGYSDKNKSQSQLQQTPRIVGKKKKKYLKSHVMIKVE